MALPKRNLFIRILYGATMLGMFAFLAWQSWLLGMTDQGPVKPATAETDAVEIKASESKPAPMAVSREQSESVTGWEISGLSRLIDLEQNPAAQIEAHWDSFVASEVAGYIDHKKPVIAIYSQYNSNANTVVLTLGVEQIIKGVPRVGVEEGSYHRYPGQTVLEAWEQTSGNYQVYRYKSDYERWQLDSNYQPQSVTAYLGMK